MKTKIAIKYDIGALTGYLCLVLTILTLSYAFFMAYQVTPKRHYLVVKPLTTKGERLVGVNVYAFLVVPGKGSVFLKSGTTGLDGRALLEISLDRVKGLVNVTEDRILKTIYNPTVLVIAVYKDLVGLASYPIADLDITKSKVMFKERESLDLTLKKCNVLKVEPLVPKLTPTLVASHIQWCKVELIHLNLISNSCARLFVLTDDYVELRVGVTTVIAGVKPMTLGYSTIRVPVSSPKNMSKSVEGVGELVLSVNMKVVWEEWEYPGGFHEHRFIIADLDFSSLSFEEGDKAFLYEENWKVEGIRETLTLDLEKNYSLNIVLPESLIKTISEKAFVPLTPPEYELGFKLLIDSGIKIRLEARVLSELEGFYTYHTWLGKTLIVKVQPSTRTL